MSSEEARWFQVCAYFGFPLANGKQHPVYVEREADGTVHLHSFCDAECKENWLDER